MNTYRHNPDGPENTAASRQHEREVFALKQQAKMNRPECPACKLPLAVAHEMDRNQVVVWCARGACPSPQASNDGAYGDTVEQAVEQLRINIDEEGMADE